MCRKLVCFVVLLGLVSCVHAAEADVDIPAAVSQQPVIDGIVDDVWSLSTEQYLEILLEGADPESDADCSGSWRALWGWDYLYVLVDMNDEALVQDSAEGEGWNDDRIEVFIDAGNEKDATTDGVNDYQYCFRWNNGVVEAPVEWYLSPDSLEGVLYAVATTDDGYLMEVALPWSTMIGGPPVAGQLIGIDVMVDDDDDGDGRDTQMSWYTEVTPPHNPSLWGTAFLVPTEKAGNPYPANGQTDVPRDVILSWVSGKNAAGHDVYFGADVDDVNEADRDNPMDVLVSLSQQDATFDPLGLLDYDQTYYWRVDEVNDSEPDSPWKGDIWSFTTRNFIVVDDFEDYNDYEPDTIYFAWVDGYGDPLNGSTSGYPNPIFSIGEHFVEVDIVHGGEQSYPYFYDNTTASISEATKTLTDLTDWTQDDVITLTLFYYGNIVNDAEPMYVALNGDAFVTHEDPEAVLAIDWNRWDILLQDFADKGADLTNVNSITIGFGNKENPAPSGKSGHVFFDDIRLYRSEPEEQEPKPEPVNPGTDNLVALYSFENNVNDSSGNGLNGTIIGNPFYVDGITGMAMSLDGGNDYIDFGNNSMFDITEQITLSAWVNTNDSGNNQHNPFVGKGDTAYAIKHSSANQIQFFIYDEGWFTANSSVSGSFNGSWHHVAGTYDGAELNLYIDGALVANTAHEGTINAQTFNLTIGTNSEAESRYYGGLIDEVRIYDRALSLNEIIYLVDLEIK